MEVGLERVRQVEHALLRWSEQFPRLRQFYDPVQVWLSKRIHPQPLQPLRIPSSSNEDAMIQILLRTVQVLYDRHPASTNEDLEIDEPPDHYIRSGSNAMCSITSSLNLESISIALNETLQCASVLPEHDVRILVGRLLPFLQIYLSFASTQMLAHGKWLKSLLKLDFVLCSLLITLVKEGFCQPKEAEEGGTGEEMGEPVQGSGLGQGSGNENVSKDIQEESQVEGLEGEDADQDNEVERAEEGDAIEMSEDIGGKMQDVPDSQSDKAEGDDDESVFDPEDQVGQLDNLDETAIDEKLWGDEKGPQESGDTSKQSNKDHSKQPGETDVVAKEQQGDEGQRENSEQELSNDDVPMESLDEETTTDNPPADGLPMDEHIPDADTLDLPDNLDMDTGNDQDKPPAGEDDDLQLENEVDMDAEADSATHSVDGGENDQGVDGDAAPDTSEIAAEVNSESPQENAETAVAQADVHGGGDGGSSGGEVPRLAERMDHIASDDAQVPAEDNTGVAQEKSETSDNLGDKG